MGGALRRSAKSPFPCTRSAPTSPWVAEGRRSAQALQTVEASPSAHQLWLTAPDRTVVSGAAWPSKTTSVFPYFRVYRSSPVSGTCSMVRSSSCMLTLAASVGFWTRKLLLARKRRAKTGAVSLGERARTPHQAIAGIDFFPFSTRWPSTGTAPQEYEQTTRSEE